MQVPESQLESGQIIVAGVELEELREERKCLAGGRHGDGGGQCRDRSADTEDQIEYCGTAVAAPRRLHSLKRRRWRG